jgi:hypothetical protein
MKRLALAAAVTAVLLASLFQSNRVRSVALLFPSLSGFDEVAADVWAEREMSAAARDRLVDTVAAARGAVERFFSGVSGHHVVLACSTARCYRMCGGIGLGTTFFGNRVLLSPGGVSSSKVSHELSHVELASRVGALRALFQVPQWFDEGLAVIVSDDPDFTEAKWLAATEGGARAPALQQLETVRGWLAATKENKQLSYGTARHEVVRWYARAGPKGLQRVFAAIRAGEKFERAYARTARADMP